MKTTTTQAEALLAVAESLDRCAKGLESIALAVQGLSAIPPTGNSNPIEGLASALKEGFTKLTAPAHPSHQEAHHS